MQVISYWHLPRSHAVAVPVPASPLARAPLAYLAKHRTESTRAELVPILGLSRPESVPDLSARFAALLQTQSNARRDLVALELALGLSGENSKSF
jgi:hypothetical protein